MPVFPLAIEDTSTLTLVALAKLTVGPLLTHAAPPGPLNPGLHVHSALAALPASESLFDVHSTQVAPEVAVVAVEYIPVVQSVHDCEPAESLYFPATQEKQKPPLEPLYPASHLQSVAKTFPVVPSVT